MANTASVVKARSHYVSPVTAQSLAECFSVPTSIAATDDAKRLAAGRTERGISEDVTRISCRAGLFVDAARDWKRNNPETNGRKVKTFATCRGSLFSALLPPSGIRSFNEAAPLALGLRGS